MYTTELHEVWVGGGSGLDAVVLLDEPFLPAPPGRPPCEEPLEPQPATTIASAAPATARRSAWNFPGRPGEPLRPGRTWRTATDHMVCDITCASELAQPRRDRLRQPLGRDSVRVADPPQVQQRVGLSRDVPVAESQQ